MHSCLYEGWVGHRRHAPLGHRFRYRLFMAYLDLDELPGLFSGHWCCSCEGANLLSFRRADYLGPATQPLAEAVRAEVGRQVGFRPEGPVRLLTHLRTWGYLFNPVSFYYCFDPQERLQAIAAQITNTPWGERHTYVLAAAERRRWRFAKGFHVSPFMPMGQEYDWRFSVPGASLRVHMENWQAGRRVFDASLALRRRPFTGAALRGALWRHPFLTLRISAGIYWQALWLKARGCPFHPHPKWQENSSR